jgi:sugar/nucleoside kinase (ribokinase family)
VTEAFLNHPDKERAMKILIAGELNPDLVLGDYEFFPQPGKEVLVKDLQLTLGSSSAICAVGLARLGNSVTFAGNVGADIYGDYCRATLEREAIDTSLVNRRADLKTGLTVSVTSARDRSLITYLGAVASLTCDDLPDKVFASYRHFHVSSYFLQSGLRRGLRGLFGAARREGVTTSLDAGWDPTETWSGDLIDTLTEVDVFLPNESEIQGITGHNDVVQGLDALDNGHTLVIGKLGEKGCITRHRGRIIRVDAFPVDVVDTTGAGDSFAAGFLHAWLRHMEMEDCMRFAAACGSLSTRGVGGTAAQPTDAEVESYLHAHIGN